MLFAGMPAFFAAKWSRRGLALGLAVVLAASVLVAVNAQEATAQSADQSAAERCSEFHLFGAEPVDVAKTADNITVLAQARWGYHNSIGCYLTLDDEAVIALRAAGPPASLPEGPTDDSRRCFEHHRFGAEPVDVAKTANGQTVLARLSWGYTDTIGCFLALNPAAVLTLRAVTPPEPPSAPGSVSADSGDGELTVTWSAPSDTGGAPIADYTVAYQAGATACPTEVDNTWNPRITSTTSATIEGLANGTAYRVCVRATNRAGDGAWGSATATPATLPGAPGNISALAGDGTLTVSWNAPTDNGGAPVTSYSVAYRANAFTCPNPNSIGNWAVRTTSSTSFTIGGLANTHSYRICVRASNSAGDSSWNSISSSPSDRPGRPTGVRFTGSGPDRLSVAWTAPASTGASAITSYTVNWCTAGSSNDVCASSWSTASATGTSHTISGLSGGNSYGVRVQAVNSRGTGPWSATRFASTTAATPPGTPTGLSATIYDRRIELVWNAPPANGAPITGYAVECRLGGTAIASGNCGSSTFTRFTTISGTSTTISGLANGTPYDIRVRASNRAGSSAWATITATPAARPRIPTNVQATARGRNIDVTWTAPASGGSPITRYIVESCSGSCTSWRSTTVSGNPPATSTTIGGLANGTTYRVRVRAINSAGDSGWSATDTATTPTPPGTPTGLTISSFGNDRLTATWTAPTAVSGISHYNVQRCTAAANQDGTWRCASGWSNAGTATDTTHVVTGLLGSTSYSVRVQAANAAGTSGWSNTYTVTTDPATAPGIPSGFTATPGHRNLRLSWTAPATNGARITRYTITCTSGTPDPDSNHRCDQTSPDNIYTTGGTSLTISGLTNGVVYTLTVSATNSAGPSGTTETTATPATRPGQPRNIVLTETYPGGNVVNLGVTWEAPSRDGGTTTDTGGSPITGYTVQYRASNGNWSFAYAGTGTSHTISGLPVGPRYYVQIRATNAVGDSSWVQATTHPTGVPGKPDVSSFSPATRGQLTVVWTAPASTGASDTITDYDVQWCTARELERTVNDVTTTTYPCTGGWRTVPDADVDGDDTSHIITGLTGSTAHSVRVRAVNVHGNGPWSDVDQASFGTTEAPDVPGSPADLTATPGNRNVRLSWTAPAANGARITRYTITCTSGITGNHVCDRTDGTNTYRTGGTSYTITGLTNGESYSFTVEATNSAGDGTGATTTATPATRPDRPDPDEVTITEAYADGLVTLTVAWAEPDDGGHPDGITGYTLQYRPSGSNWSFHYAGTDRTSTITGLPVGRRYDVQIRAQTPAGVSSWTQKSITPTGRPTAPTGVSVATGTNAVTASWSAPDIGASAITNYNVQWCLVTHNMRNTPTDPSDDIYTCGGWRSGGTVDDAITTLEITNLPCGRRIGVRVQAVNSYGGGPWSDTARDEATWSVATADCPT